MRQIFTVQQKRYKNLQYFQVLNLIHQTLIPQHNTYQALLSIQSFTKINTRVIPRTTVYISQFWKLPGSPLTLTCHVSSWLNIFAQPPLALKIPVSVKIDAPGSPRPPFFSGCKRMSMIRVFILTCFAFKIHYFF